MDKYTRRRLADMVLQRICFVCGERVPERRPDQIRLSDAPGTYHAGYRILVHTGECADIVRQEARIYDRSAHGRWRPPAQVRVRLTLLRQARQLEKTSPQAPG